MQNHKPNKTNKGTTTGTNKGMFAQDDDEEELSRFVCELYDSIFTGGARVNVALQQALASQQTIRYLCHFPIVPFLIQIQDINLNTVKKAYTEKLQI